MNFDKPLHDLRAVANTPELANDALKFAWDGYEYLPQKTKGSGCGVAIGIGLVVLSLAGFGQSSIVGGIICLLCGVVFVVGGQSWSLPQNVKTNKQREELQQVGLAFLNRVYPELVKAVELSFKSLLSFEEIRHIACGLNPCHQVLANGGVTYRLFSLALNRSKLPHTY